MASRERCVRWWSVVFAFLLVTAPVWGLGAAGHLLSQVSPSGTAEELHFADDYARSALCVNSLTGSWAWTVLKGNGAGKTYSGTGTIVNGTGDMRLTATGGSGYGLNLIYYTTARRATATFTFRPDAVSSALYDQNTLDDGPCIEILPAFLPPGTLGETYASTYFTEAGGVGTVTWSESGALPAGMSFSGGALWGEPAAAGCYPLTVTATDSDGSTGSRDYLLVVNCADMAISLSPAALPQAAINAAYVPASVLASGGTAPYTYQEAGALPLGMSFTDNGDGTSTFAGTPVQNGVFPVSVAAIDANGCAGIEDYLLAVACSGTSLSLTPGSLSQATAGAPYTFAFNAGGGTSPYTFSEAGVLPSGMNFIDDGNGTAALAGTPMQAGTFPVAVAAADAHACAVAHGCTLTVACPAITVTGPAVTTGLVGTPFSQKFTESGAVGTATFATASALPPGLSLSSEGTLSGTPAQGGAFPLVVTVTDSAGCSGTGSTYLLSVDQPPAITSANSAAFTAGTAGTFTVTATGYPAPTLGLTGTLPSGVSFNASTGVLSGTPGAGTGGAYPLTITASNGIGTAASQSFTLTVGQAPAITSANAATFTAGTAGNFTVTATGYPVPTLGLTGTLPSGVSFNASTGVLSGTPAAGTGGTYALTITASNGVSPNATQSFTLTVDQAPAITSPNSATFTAGTAGTFTVTATGYPAPALGLTGTLPSGVSFNASTGVLAGTPAAGTGGTYALTITASNGIGAAASRNFTLTVGQAPSITSANAATFTVGTAGTFTVTATGYPAPTLGLTGTLPSGVSFNASTGVLSGTPAAGTGGTYALTITASNGVGAAASQSFTLTVDQAPAITSPNSATFTAGTAGTFTVRATGYPAPALGLTGTLPSGVSFNASTGVLSGTPGAGTGGAYPLTITASNGIGTTASQSFTLTVGQAPAITSANAATFTAGTAGSFTVTVTGYPAPTLGLTGTLPSGVTFKASAGVLSGTPAAGAGGSYPLTITASNGVSPNATQSFTLTVDQAPAITSPNSATFTAGTAGTFTVTATGYPAPALGLTGTLPSGVSFNASTGVLAGTPAAGTGGTYALTITASNGIGAAASRNFTLTVGQAPSITSANAATFTVGTAGTFTVTATGYPAPTLGLTGTLPSGVSFNASTGVLSGTPAAGTGGTYALTITASNGVGAAASQSFTLTVDQAPAITSPNSATFTAGTAGTFTVRATGYPAPALGLTGTLPSGVSFNASTGVLSGTPGAGTGGAYPLTITASNGIGTTASQSFTLTVGQAPAITSANAATFTAGTAGSFTVTVTGYPAPTLGLTGTLPSGVTFKASAGVLSGTPAAGAGGSYPLTITASNGVSPNATQSFTLTVDQAPAITSPNSATFTAGTAGTFTVTATGYPAPALGLTGTLPSGVSFNASTGVLSGTPGTGTGGTYPLTITASNGIGTTASQSFTLTVGQAPSITSANAATFTAGTSGSFTVTATGYPAPTLGLTGILPSGVTFNGSTGVLSGTPAAGTGGTYALTITASNGVGTAASQSFTLTIDEAPAITSANSATFTIGTSGSFTVSASGYPAPTLGLTGTLPSGVSFNASTGVLSGTPAASTGGSYPLTITASNGVLPDATQTFTLTVNCPTIIVSPSGLAAGTAGTAYTPVTFGATGGSGTYTFSESGALPTGMSFVAGVLSGTPTQTGSFRILVIATDSLLCTGGESIPLQVVCAPVTITTMSVPSGTVNTAYGPVTLAQTGGVGTITWSLSGGALPSGVTLAAAGVLSGTPTQTGNFPITVTATDSDGCKGRANYALMIACPVITVTNPAVTTATAGTAFSQDFTESGAAGTATFNTTSTLPAGLALSSGGALSGTPAQGGSFTIVVTVTDASGCTGTGSPYTLTVNQAPAITSTNAATFYLGQQGSFTVTATGYPSPALSLAGTLPSGVTFDAATGVLSGTPAAGTGGAYPLTITASNGISPDATQAFTLTVSCPWISLGNFTGGIPTQGTAYDGWVTVSGGTAPYTFVASGQMDGLTLSSSGELTGIPTSSGQFSLTVTVTDADGCTGSSTYAFMVQSGGGGGGGR